MTIGADFAVKETSVDENNVKFQIWDLAGQPRFSSVRELYYKGSCGGLLIYDCTRPESFQNLDEWIEELWKNNGRGKVPLILIANKVDLREENPDSISTELGLDYLKRLNERTAESGFESVYIETSAKTGQNVDMAFHELARVVITHLS